MKVKLIMAVLIMVAVMVIPAQAQETGEPQMQEEEMEIPDGIEDDLMVTYGTIVSMADDKIVILEYDFDLDEDIEVAYMVDENTLFEEIESLGDLRVDDPLEIVYEEKGDERLALLIKKEDFGIDDLEEIDALEDSDDMGEILNDLDALPDDEAGPQE